MNLHEYQAKELLSLNGVPTQGIDIPKEKRGVISLTYIYGIGISK